MWHCSTLVCYTKLNLWAQCKNPFTCEQHQLFVPSLEGWAAVSSFWQRRAKTPGNPRWPGWRPPAPQSSSDGIHSTEPVRHNELCLVESMLLQLWVTTFPFHPFTKLKGISQWVQKQQYFKSFLTSHLSHQGKNISSLLQPLVKVFSSLPGISIFTGRHIYPGFQNDPLREREERTQTKDMTSQTTKCHRTPCLSKSSSWQRTQYSPLWSHWRFWSFSLCTPWLYHFVLIATETSRRGTDS